MSGFEVAGIVLGSIPLVISALEHYGEGLSTIQRWRKYKRELQSLVRNLQTERVKLQNVCEKLLVGIVPPSDIEAMIDDPLGGLWRQDAVQKRIQFRLWKSYDVFEATISDIKLRRGIFTLKRSRYDDQLSTIRNGVSNLENLTDRNIELEPERRVRSQTKLFTVLRDMATSFHRALRSGFRCSCKHDVGLGLQRRSADICPTDDSDKIMKDLCFRLAISFVPKAHLGEASPEEISTWQEVLIRAAWEPASRTLSPSCTTKSTPAQTRVKARKAVSFGFSQSTTLTSSTSTTTTTIVTQTNTELQTLLPKLTLSIASGVAFSNAGDNTLDDLCEKLRQSQKQAATDTYGILIDQLPQSSTSTSTRRYSIHPAPDSNDSHSSWSLVSLREILEHKALFPPLSYRDRLRLAVTISSSVLQLHGTPWLPTILTSRHIYFIRKPDSPTMYWYPILLKQHHPPLEGKDQLEPVSDCGGTTTGSSIMAKRNPTLLSLGCVLIEVILGRTLDQSRGGGSPNRQDVGVDLMSDYVAAQSLMDEVRMKSLNYEAAVARCVDDGKLHRHDRGLEDVDLCQDVYSRVVALLEKDLETS
ncbi:uncharacterized protein B0T15DRAFT_568749 [Chaetomium strumarium]|uniref:DUF7580 domain-containing protein n=1 Tax=Chaetomium strumarium TaxID=1170767 RepID=A0AAJ0GN62_9PEZI|nr:hypothetical protein B0T15DRAFT_568749 [Chaetomium strumarium]